MQLMVVDSLSTNNHNVKKKDSQQLLFIPLLCFDKNKSVVFLVDLRRLSWCQSLKPTLVSLCKAISMLLGGVAGLKAGSGV